MNKKIIIIVVIVIGGVVLSYSLWQSDALYKEKNITLDTRGVIDTPAAHDTTCDFRAGKPEEALEELNKASQNKDIEKIICLNLPGKRNNLRQIITAIKERNALASFFKQLQQLKETHRTKDYVEYTLESLSENGQKELSTVYLYWDSMNQGWYFDGL